MKKYFLFSFFFSFFALCGETSHVFRKDGDWHPYKLSYQIEPGSPLDFSFLLDAPAGKYGTVKVKGDQFVFEKKDMPIRFLGTNICFGANFPSREDAEKLADRIARSGFNNVRFHHFDSGMTRYTADGFEIIPEKLDKLHYLQAALKKRGVYFTLDIYTNRKPGPRYAAKNIRKTTEYKYYAMLDPEICDDLKKFTKLLLTTVNPYTGMTWAEDPALSNLGLINENPTFPLTLRSPELCKELRDLYWNAFDKWVKEKGHTVTKNNRDILENRCFDDLYDNYLTDMMQFVRSLGVKAPLSDVNNYHSPNLYRRRVKLDYVDDHQYHDHPSPLRRPFKMSGLSAIKEKRLDFLGVAPIRIYGKPFTVTEFDFCYPNPYRAEMGPLFGYFAAMQGWNGIWHFAFSHGHDKFGREPFIDIFDSVNDPVRALTLRITAALFLRRDAAESKQFYALDIDTSYNRVYPKNWLFPGGARPYATHGKLGCVAQNGPAPAGAIRLNVDQLGGVYGISEKIETSTGEAVVDFKTTTFLVDTPRTAAFVLQEGKMLKTSLFTVKARKGFVVVSAISLDKKPLSESRKILFLHLSDNLLAGTEYTIKQGKLQCSVLGRKKPLMRHSVIWVQHNLPGHWMMTPLDYSGKADAAAKELSRNMELDNFQHSNNVISVWLLERTDQK